MTRIKQASVLEREMKDYRRNFRSFNDFYRLATARAHNVFPVPGGPYNSTPFGGSIPKLTNFSG